MSEDRAPDVPCPKCGGEDISLAYQKGGSYYEGAHEMCREEIPRPVSDADPVGRSFAEHFHRHCRRCQYTWPTNDVLGAS
jgi:hypothetical protein